MKPIVFGLLALVLAGAACGGGSPAAPTPQPPQPAAEFAQVIGRVYGNHSEGDPLLAGAVINVTESDGTRKTARSDDEGFYEISVRPGNVAITVSKEGYEVKSSELALVGNTVLNFSLNPL